MLGLRLVDHVDDEHSERPDAERNDERIGEQAENLADEGHAELSRKDMRNAHTRRTPPAHALFTTDGKEMRVPAMRPLAALAQGDLQGIVIGSDVGAAGHAHDLELGVGNAVIDRNLQ